MTKTCILYKKHVSITLGAFFKPFNKPLLLIFKAIIRYSTKTSKNSIVLHFGEVYWAFVLNICDRIFDYMPICNFSSHKLGGPGKIVQIDKTMMNYKCKSHRSRLLLNRFDALCIVEVHNKTTRAFATIIADKTSETLISTIC